MPEEVLLITSTNLACDPRCLKEVRLLLSKNITVSVLAFHLHNWTDEKERQLNIEFPNVHFHYLETTRHSLFPWLFSTLLERSARLLTLLFPKNIYLCALSLSKRTWLLKNWARQNLGNFQLVIAHNPPAFYPAAWLAKKMNTPFAVDIEDYHPGESNSELEKKNVATLMRSILSTSVYTSFASPLIRTYTENLLGAGHTNNFIVVNNTFPASEFSMPVSTGEDKLQLVWFSQFIDYGRGLDTILPFLDKFKNDCRLTLIGNMRKTFFDNELSAREYIHCISPLSQNELHQQLSKYDIGLALEDAMVDLNRNLCLTNKIWAYIQSGLFVLASDTAAQTRLLGEHPDHGTMFSLTSTGFENAFSLTVKNKEQIRMSRQRRFEKAKSLSWENDRQVLLEAWEGILQ